VQVAVDHRVRRTRCRWNAVVDPHTHGTAGADSDIRDARVMEFRQRAKITGRRVGQQLVTKDNRVREDESASAAQRGELASERPGGSIA
jgi:hypothetical protein